MEIGLPKEIKPFENRVGLTPGGVAALVAHGHQVWVERGAGAGSAYTDSDYVQMGAELTDAAGAWSRQLVVKVKEPVAEEYGYLRNDLMLFTYLHLAANRPLTEALLGSGTLGIAYETVQLPDGTLPLLLPMSEVAGRMAPQVGAHLLERSQGGRGVLLGGVPGVAPGVVVVLGGGTVGTNAARVALGLGAQVKILDINHGRLGYLDLILGGRIETIDSNPASVKAAVVEADLLIGAVLIPGRRAPVLVDRSLVARMKPGSVIVDVAVDQGGCVETIYATTHDEPSYLVDGVIHYGVANMPGAVPRTSTQALSNQTLPYVLALADKGLGALLEDPALARGVNTWRGELASREVALSFGLPYREVAFA